MKVGAIALSLLLLTTPHSAFGQAATGDETSKRLEQEKQGKNKYRGGEDVADMQAAKSNMEKLFEPIMIQGKGDSKADKWHSPHLRDMAIDQLNRNKEAVQVRGQTIPQPGIAEYCLNSLNPPIQAACPITVPSRFGGEVCQWHGEKFGPHRPVEACYREPTTKYKELIQDQNFKVCCVRKEEKTKTSEQIAIAHPDGSGWAGLWEYYYPTNALGWENERTTTMITDKQKVKECVKAADPIMESPEAAKWVAGAIERNLKTAGGGQGGGNASQVEQEVNSIIKDARPKDKDLRFADSLQGEGLTLRINLAFMDPDYRKKLAERFCMRPEQFDKLLDPEEDTLQWQGGKSLDDLNKIPVWSNYCKEGVELMTDPQKSFQLRNVYKTPTDFTKGMQVWMQDPMYCQRMNLENPNMQSTKIGEVIQKTPGGQYSQQQVGYTCLQGGELNGGMVPVSLYRHAAVERRTAIADHAVGFLIAGGLAPGMITGSGGSTKVNYKGFEPQAYSRDTTPPYRTFIGPQFTGGGANELGEKCESIQGENFRWENKADRLYISKTTHQPFTQKPIDEKNDINKYVQDWSDDQKDNIPDRGLDDKSQNYAAAFRIFATCPAGYVRWEPPQDEHDAELLQNIENFCRKENFGGDPR